MTKRRKPKQERSQALVDAIVEATVLLLSGGGSEKPPVRAIAKRAGVGIGSIYDYFKTRDGIMEVVVTRVTKDNFDDLKAVLDAHDDGTAEDAVVAVMDRVFGIYLDQPWLTRAALRTIVSVGAAEAIVAERDRFVQLVVERIGREIPKNVSRDRLTDRALVIVDMLLGVVLGEVHRNPTPLRRETARNVMRRMIRAEIAEIAQIAGD